MKNKLNEFLNFDKLKMIIADLEDFEYNTNKRNSQLIFLLEEKLRKKIELILMHEWTEVYFCIYSWKNILIPHTDPVLVKIRN